MLEDWRADLDRLHKGERAALGKEHADSAGQIERKVRKAYRKGVRDAERREPPSAIKSITRIPPRLPQPRALSVAWRVRAMSLDVARGQNRKRGRSVDPLCPPPSRF